jgi:hypothetical protein
LSAIDALVLVFSALPAAEQDEAHARIADARLTRLATEEDDTARFLAALRRVADLVDGELTTTNYQMVWRRLRDDGDDLPNVSSVIRFFGGWLAAKEALALAEVTTSRRIEARFRARLNGLGPHFAGEELRDALVRCAEELGRPPLLAQYEEWRRKELALARSRGERGRVPSPACFRRRYGGWEKALLAAGFSPDDVYVRLEPDSGRRKSLVKVDRYSDATLRETLLRCALALGHAPLISDFSAWRAKELKRLGPVAVLPTDSPYRYRYGTWEKALGHFGFSEEQIAARLDRGRERSNVSLRFQRLRRETGTDACAVTPSAGQAQ